MKRFIICVITFAGACQAPAALTNAAPAAVTAPASTEDLTVITSDKLTFDYKKHYALFENNVVVIDPQMKLMADRMTVTFDDSNKVQNIRSDGHVIILQEDKKAHSDLATYDVATGEIVLTGNPQVTRGEDVLTGKTIIFYRDENRMRVENGATLYLKSDGKNGNKTDLKGDLFGGKKGGK